MLTLRGNTFEAHVVTRQEDFTIEPERQSDERRFGVDFETLRSKGSQLPLVGLELQASGKTMSFTVDPSRALLSDPDLMAIVERVGSELRVKRCIASVSARRQLTTDFLTRAVSTKSRATVPLLDLLVLSLALLTDAGEAHQTWFEPLLLALEGHLERSLFEQ